MIKSALNLDASPTILMPVRKRNEVLDALFYDVGSLTSNEQASLRPFVDREGSILVVSPRNAGQRIRHYKTALRFINNEGDQVQAIVVAGVGSSALGTAALARNVADAYGYDVAGIVTGYGVADILSEALGGWFFYGTIDRWRLDLEKFAESLHDYLPETSATGNPGNVHDSRQFNIPSSLETGVLLDVLISRPKALRLLVGHSKGSHLIDFVLERFAAELEGEDHPYFSALQIVTVGAVVALPGRFHRCRQFIGSIDWFGALNSRPGIEHDKVEGAWHHLNTALPYHLSVRKVLQNVTV